MCRFKDVTDFGSCSLEESQSLTRATAWDGWCQQATMETRGSEKQVSGGCTGVVERLVVFRTRMFGSVPKAQQIK